jgi:DNA-binding response OmpR family regulator
MNTLLETACDQAGPSPTRRQENPSVHILVVDDDGEIRQLSAQALVLHGYRVDAAKDGAAAWEALHAHSYDLLITDNNMPKLSGMELLKKLRSASMTLPVILASGELPTEELDRNPWLQLAATLVKPFSCGQLLETVRSVLHAADHTCNRAAVFSPVPREDPIQITPASQWGLNE